MANQELLNYIKQARVAGQTDEQIKTMLIGAGWDETDVNHALDPSLPEVVNYTADSASGAENQNTNVRYAGFWIRFLAYFIDGIAFYIPSMFFGILAMTFGGGQLAVALSKILDVLILGGIYIYIIYRYQATPGKMALGLIIVSDNFKRIPLGQILLREIIGKIASAIILYIGFIMVAFTAKKQGLHDMIAKTLVIYKD